MGKYDVLLTAQESAALDSTLGLSPKGMLVGASLREVAVLMADSRGSRTLPPERFLAPFAPERRSVITAALETLTP